MYIGGVPQGLAGGDSAVRGGPTALRLRLHKVGQDLHGSLSRISVGQRWRARFGEAVIAGSIWNSTEDPQGSHVPVTAQSSRVILPDRSPHTRGEHSMARRAEAKPR